MGEYHVEEEEDESEQKPFKCILDVGIRRSVTGARMWGALKGAADGGLHVPHSAKNFPGFKPAEEKGAEPEYDDEAHFAKFVASGCEPDNLEEMYGAAHKKIRENPDFQPVTQKGIKWERKGNKVTSSDGKDVNRSVKLSLKQRREKVRQKIEAAQAKMAAEDDE